tara:strand:+ start:5779 stop:9645 length:3867 start_codon:yes stop_codon:yes gene_type:complete
MSNSRKSGVALVTVLIFLALVLPALVIILSFARNEIEFGSLDWERKQSDQMSKSGLDIAENMLNTGFASLNQPIFRFPMDKDQNGTLDDIDGDLTLDEWAYAFPFSTISHLSSPWIKYPVLSNETWFSRDLVSLSGFSTAQLNRPAGSLPVYPLFKDKNNTGFVDYSSYEHSEYDYFDPSFGCAENTTSSWEPKPCLIMSFIPFGKKTETSPVPSATLDINNSDFMWNGNPYSSNNSYNPAQLRNQTFVSDWSYNHAITGDRDKTTAHIPSNFPSLGSEIFNPYADRLKAQLSNCNPSQDEFFVRDLFLSSSGMTYPLQLDKSYENETESRVNFGLPNMPDSYIMFDPRTCMPLYASQAKDVDGGYEVVVSDEGARFPLYGFLHNPDDPSFNNPMLLESINGLGGNFTIVDETSFIPRMTGSNVDEKGEFAHLAQRGIVSLLAPFDRNDYNTGHAAAMISYVGFNDVGDISSLPDTVCPKGNCPDGERFGLGFEKPLNWPEGLKDILDVDGIKLRDGLDSSFKINDKNWKDIQARVSLHSTPQERSTINIQGNALNDPRFIFYPFIDSRANPEMEDPVLRCRDSDSDDFCRSNSGLFKVDLWQTPTSWPTGSSSDPVSNVLSTSINMDSADWVSSGCSSRFQNIGDINDYFSLLGRGNAPAGFSSSDLRHSVWSEEFYWFVNCFWKSDIRNELVDKKDEIEAVLREFFHQNGSLKNIWRTDPFDDFPDLISEKIVGHWAAWQYFYRYFDDEDDCRDISPEFNLDDSSSITTNVGNPQVLLAERHARYHGPADLGMPIGNVRDMLGSTLIPYPEMNGPFWDPGNVGSNSNPGCGLTSLDGDDFPDMTTNIPIQHSGGVVANVNVNIEKLNVMPAVWIPNSRPSFYSEDPPYDDFDFGASEPVSGWPIYDPLGYDSRNKGLGNSNQSFINRRDDSLILHLISSVAFFDSPYATYFDDPHINEPCLVSDDFFDPIVGASNGTTDPWDNVLGAGGSLTTMDLNSTFGGWWEADGRNIGSFDDSDCNINDPTTDIGFTPLEWRPLKTRGRVNINTAAFDVLHAAFAKVCDFDNGVGIDIFNNSCGSLPSAIASILNYREYYYSDPNQPFDDISSHGTLFSWLPNGVALHGGSFIEQFFNDINLYTTGNCRNGSSNGTSCALQNTDDILWDWHTGEWSNNGLNKIPFRTITQLLDLSDGVDPRNLNLSPRRLLSVNDIANNSNGAIAVLARIDQDFSVFSQGYRIESMGSYGRANSTLFKILGLDGNLNLTVFEEEKSGGTDDSFGLYFGSYYK